MKTKILALNFIGFDLSILYGVESVNVEKWRWHMSLN